LLLGLALTLGLAWAPARATGLDLADVRIHTVAQLDGFDERWQAITLQIRELPAGLKKYRLEQVAADIPKWSLQARQLSTNLSGGSERFRTAFLVALLRGTLRAIEESLASAP
jgi:hypothetical protein